MNLRQLNLFVEVAEVENVRRAAERMRISQPALTRQIQALEAFVGTPLFDRVKKRIVLTAAGRRMLEHARAILRQVACAREDVRAEATTPAGMIVIGLAPALGEFICCRLAQTCRERYPALTLSFCEGLTEALSKALRAGAIDIALLGNPSRDSALKCEPLCAEGYFLVGAQGMAASKGRTVAISRLTELPLLGISGRNMFRQTIDRLAEQMGRKLNVVCEVDSLSVLRQMIRARLGYAVLTHSAIHAELRSGEFRASAIRGVQLTWNLATRSTTTNSPAMEAVKAELAATVSALRAEGVFG